MNKYEDIINMPHHVSATRMPMSMANRAAQFAPFAALSGHDEAIMETARFTSEKPELSSEELASLSRKLTYAMQEDAEVTITYFQADPFKEGGSCRMVKGKVKRIDETSGRLILKDTKTLPLDNVLRIEGSVFDNIDF